MKSNAAMPDLSIVIVNYKTRDLLHDCLMSLMVVPLILEIIVVDNASNDGSAAMVAQDFPQVMLLKQSTNTWFCGGNNIGIRQATSDYVLLLNPDTTVPSDSLLKMLNYLRQHPDYGGVTCQLRYPDGSIQRTCSKRPTYSYLLFANTTLGLLLAPLKKSVMQQHWYSDWERTTDQDVEVMPGSCMVLHREEALLNETLLLYFPEDDLAQRLKKPFRFLAQTHILHHEKSSTQSWRATQVYFHDLYLYTRIYHGLAGMLLMWLLSQPLYLGLWIKRHLIRRGLHG